MKQKHTPTMIRIPPDLREHLRRYADLNQRSLTGEVVYRLERTRKEDHEREEQAA